MAHTVATDESSTHCQEEEEEKHIIVVVDPDQEEKMLELRRLLGKRKRPETRANEQDDGPVVRRLRSGVVTRRGAPSKRRSRTRAAMDRLHDEILVHVFSYLDHFPDLLAARQVCKRWHKLSWDPRLWRNLSFQGHENVASADLESLFKDVHALRGIRSLSLAKVHNLSVEDVRLIPRTDCAASLETVDLSWCTGANDKSVVEYSRCPRLRELRLSHCRAVTRRSVRILAVRCPRLELLDLNCIGGIRDSLLEVIGMNCWRLRTLNLANSRNITDEGITALAKGCVMLEALDLSWCPRITDSAVSEIAEKMPRLREVGLSETRVTNYGISELARNCHQLEALHLARCVQISNEGAESILRYCKDRVTSLNIASCHNVTDEFVEELIRVCPRLSCLDVSKLPCRSISKMLETVAAERDIELYF